ncbi:unnamed protein product [Durusdinium trenchii]|uniref:Uncharacterized protein n=1 Tax=Durusdinium trenchii TaxID=1381693 RepID=A0ABP0JKC2_9DINO
MLHELLVKAVCAGREPLQWKAGRAVPLYKKGAISNPDNYRSIFLFDSIAKLHHNLLRDRLYATYEKVASKACFGGRKGCGTDMGHYMLQSLLSLSEYAAVSAAFVFLDLHAAFYSVIRQGLFGQPLHDEYLCMFLARQGISPQELDEWEKQAQLDYALQGQSQLVQNWAQDAFKNAHFSMKGLKSLALTSRGTRPGDPIGDICFNIIMQKVLAEVRQRVSNWGCADLLEQPVQEVLGQDLPGFLDVSFFDDVAFGILHASHERLIAAAAVVLSALCDSARTRGLQVNFQAEKIELMLVLKGRGEYHERARLMAHLYYSRDCADKLEALFEPLPLALVEELDQIDRDKAADLKLQGWSLKKAHLPACRVPFVQLPPSDSPEARAIRAACSSGEPAVKPWYHVGGTLVRQEEQQLAEPSLAVEKIVSGQAKGHQVGAGGAFAATSLSVWYARVAVRCKIFVHLFSGHRRATDLQHQIEHHKWVGTVQCFCLSIDLCLQGSAGDLLDRERIEWWRVRILAGQVCGVGGAPLRDLVSCALDGRGPPPLRDKNIPWGLPWISRRQREQVMVGTGLLQVAIELLLLCTYVGGCGFLEHPEYPRWMKGTPCPSIWTLEVMQVLASCEAVNVVSFDQCIYGAGGVKPTTLLLVRLPFFREITLQTGLHGRCHHGPGAHVSLVGREGASFRTARAKVYPAGLNIALAEAFHSYVARLNPVQCDRELPREFHDLHEVGAVEEPAVVQPDYHSR